MMAASPILLACLVLLPVALAQNCVHSVPLWPHQNASTHFTATLDSSSVPVEDFHGAHLVPFSLGGPQCTPSGRRSTVLVLSAVSGQRVVSFTVRPAALNVSAEVSEDQKALRISLPETIDTGVQLVITINSLPMVVVMVDQYDASLDEFHARGRTVLDVTQKPYNADPTGKHVAGAALQRALDDATFGNVVLVPPGVYSLTHTLNWTASASGVTLFLNRGATLRTVSNRSQLYMVPHTKYYFLEPLMVLKGAVDVSIRGRGNLDANGFALMGPKPKKQLQAGGSLSHDVTWAYRRRCLDSDYSGLSKRPANVFVEGISIRDATTWSLAVANVTGLIVKGVKVSFIYRYISRESC